MNRPTFPPHTAIHIIALAIVVLSFPAASASAQEAFIVRDVRVFDGVRTEEHRSVLVDSGRIMRVSGPDLRVAGASVVDGRGRTLLPGLIDSHVHVASDVNSALQQALVLGVTTVLDMFSDETTFEKISGTRSWEACNHPRHNRARCAAGARRRRRRPGAPVHRRYLIA
jgi:adenine deaminase